jgi:serine/threonine protein kinase
MNDYFDTEYVYDFPNNTQDPPLTLRIVITSVFDVSGKWSSTPIKGVILDKFFEQLDYLHKIGIVHCDLEAKNVLLNIGNLKRLNECDDFVFCNVFRHFFYIPIIEKKMKTI